MSLIHLDSFDTYVTADLGLRYSVSSHSIVTTNPRTGAQCLRDTNPGFQNTTKPVPALASYVHGIAVLRVGASNPGIADFRESTTQHVTVYYDGAAGLVRVKRGGVFGTELGNAALVFGADTWIYFEVKVTVHDSTGSVEVRINGSDTPLINLTSVDTKNGSTGVIDNIRLISPSGSVAVQYDDWYICDLTGSINNDFLGDVRVDAIVPDGDGTTTGLATTFPASPTDHYSKVDEAQQDGDTSYNEDSVDNVIDLFTFGNLPALTGTGVVHGIQTVIVAKKSDAGSKGIREKLRAGATNYSGASKVLGTGYQQFLELRETNPNTAVAFTEADINSGIEVGYEVLP